MIKTLPPEVINLIAAGEVIDSFAAVVRELVENALDAGATRISIALFPQLWRVQVADNGTGMSLEDLKLCAQAHSTSKIYTLDDLGKITSLGFRGEALHSLAQVSDLEIASRSSADNASGWRIFYQRTGEIEKQETTAIAVGTIVVVSNLFANFSVRRQGLPSLSQQLKTVQKMIHNIALCHPNITWQIWQNDQLWFHISSAATVQQIIPQLLQRIHLNDLQSLVLEIETPQKSQAKIELAIGLPDRCHRRRPDWVKIAVNGRIIRSSELEQTILSAFSRTLPRDHFPVCFLHLKICPSQIDWHRHPAKIEIYLHSLEFWQEQIRQAIEQALRLNSATLPVAVENQRVSQLLKVSEEKSSYNVNQKSQTEISLIELKAIAQVNKIYIVAEHFTGLWLIEQHIAHERILYEQLQDNWQLVPLETPIILSQLSSNQVSQLQRLGVEIESFGEQMWAVRNAPKILVKREDCTAALLELSLGGDLQTAQVATACRSAIRNGTVLSLAEMQTILDQWKITRNPRTCPHGRPIYLSLEETSLARFFRRSWVIGKSHGI